MDLIERKIRIGIFFDGTGNNAQNAIKREFSSEKLGKSSSYLISQTNIYRLFKNYVQNSSDEVKAIYIEGIGTLDHFEDSTASSATGYDIWEGYSAHAKTQKAFENLCRFLEELAIKSYKDKITLSLILDLFGFSRGAALARNFANYIVEKKVVLERILQQEGHVFKNLEIGFMGLFDTVESIQLSSLNLSLSNVTPSGVFHITALHECRENFPLTSIFETKEEYANAHVKGSGYHQTKNHFELRVPGAHSDVGGGYNETENEVRTINMNATYRVSGAMSDAEQILKDNPDFKSLLYNLSYEFETKSLGYNTISRRKEVKGHLQYVYGNLMLEVAQQFGVPFNDADFEQLYSIPADLKGFSSIIKKQKQQLLNKERIATELEKDLPQLDSVLKNYVHISVSTRTILGKEDIEEREDIPKPLLKKTLSSTSAFTNPTQHLIINRPANKWQRMIKFE